MNNAKQKRKSCENKKNPITSMPIFTLVEEKMTAYTLNICHNNAKPFTPA